MPSQGPVAATQSLINTLQLLPHLLELIFMAGVGPSQVVDIVLQFVL